MFKLGPYLVLALMLIVTVTKIALKDSGWSENEEY